MPQHGAVHSANDAGNIASSPLMQSPTGDQKPAYTQTFSIPAPERSGTSLVSALSGSKVIRPFVRLWKMGWTAEVLSLLFALLSLLGLIATLIAHQDKPLPDWPQLVSLNSIISLFSLMIRTGVGVVLAEGISQSKWMWFRKARKLDDMERFDTASRGAFGSFLLLINVGPRRPHWIAALGALLMIMAAFTGFASQQLLVFDQCLRRDTSARVEIAKSNSFFLTGPHTTSIMFSISEPMAGAIEGGIVQPNQDFTTTLSRGCVTGNCTFPSAANGGASFSSLAIGHKCQDMTSKVFTAPINTTYSDMEGNTRSVFWANLTAPDGSNNTFSSTGLQIGASPYMFSTRAYTDTAYGSIAILQMVLVRGAGQTNYSAYSCSLYPTLNTYEVNITKSVMREKLLESVPIGVNLISLVNTTADERPIQFKRASSFRFVNGSRQDCERRETAGPGFDAVAEANVNAAPNTAKYPPDVQKRIWHYPKDCVWRFGQGTAMGITDYLKEIFEEKLFYYEQMTMGTAGPIHLRRLFREGNITLETLDEDMTSLTRSMTAIVRTFGQEGEAAYANGTQWYSTTCLGINWPWLAFDGAMIALTAVFLLLVSIESRGVESERLWKSSVLATLFCEVDHAARIGVEPVAKEKMGAIASSTSVRIDPRSQRLRLLVR